jgi:hypothetical protein
MRCLLILHDQQVFVKTKTLNGISDTTYNRLIIFQRYLVTVEVQIIILQVSTAFSTFNINMTIVKKRLSYNIMKIV